MCCSTHALTHHTRLPTPRYTCKSQHQLAHEHTSRVTRSSEAPRSNDCCSCLTAFARSSGVSSRDDDDDDDDECGAKRVEFADRPAPSRPDILEGGVSTVARSTCRCGRAGRHAGLLSSFTFSRTKRGRERRSMLEPARGATAVC